MRKSILVLLFLLILPSIFAQEQFTTEVNISLTNTSMKLIGENGAQYTSTTGADLTDTMKITLYRDTQFKPQLDNLTNNYGALTGLYTERFGNATGYYTQYSNCYFALLELNNSYTSCDEERILKINESELCSTEKADCITQRDNYKSQYSISSNELTICQEELEDQKGNLWWGVLFGAVPSGLAVWFFEKQKRPTTDRHPIDDTEEMEL